MATATTAAPYRRARTDSQKTERRRLILAAADELVRARGLDSFSMALLAERAGIAKGTLYLYFETREEVLLWLYSEHLRRFSGALLAGVRAGMTDDEFAAAYLEAATADPVFLELSASLGSVIENNVSIEKVVESKRVMRDLLVPLAAHLERCLGLDEGRGATTIAAVTALLLGAWQIDAGPSLDGEDVPEDIVAMTQLFGCRSLFLTAAPALLAAARSAPAG